MIQTRDKNRRNFSRPILCNSRRPAVRRTGQKPYFRPILKDRTSDRSHRSALPSSLIRTPLDSLSTLCKQRAYRKVKLIKQKEKKKLRDEIFFPFFTIQISKNNIVHSL